MFAGKMKPGEGGITPPFVPLPAKAEDLLTELEFRLDELVGAIKDLKHVRIMAEHTAAKAEIDRLHAAIRFNARQAAEVSFLDAS